MIREAQKVYMIGIKGVGMASLSVLLQKLGKQVSGTDVAEEFQTDEMLRKHNIQIDTGFAEDIVPDDTDIVVTTGAFGGLKNPSVVTAQSKGIPVLTHAQALGEVMKLFDQSVAVCGSHGKTTTSALLSFIMVKLNMPVAYQVGVPSFSGLEGGDLYGTSCIVVESDEYAASPGTDNSPRFMYQDPRHILCTNVDYEHVDVYESLSDVKNAFTSFFDKLPEDGSLVLCADDENAVESAKRSVSKAKQYSFGMKPGSFAHVSNVRREGDFTHFELSIDSTPFGNFKTKMIGEHNVRNVTGVLAMLQVLGVDLHRVKEILPQFTTAKRRFERIFENHDFILVDDYAHHPRELEALISGARQAYPSRKLVVIFQPHTFTRTAAFKSEFITAMLKADKTLLLDIFASARETVENPEVTSQSIANEVSQEKVEYVPGDELIKRLGEILQPGDVVITAGAADTYKYHNAIIKLMKGNTT